MGHIILLKIIKITTSLENRYFILYSYLFGNNQFFFFLKKKKNTHTHKAYF